ncbi:MAG: UDP-glucose 4-epimerase GalE [Acidobacteriota bacterium]
MKKILVTGGAGYIGSHAVKELVRRNYSVLVLDNLVYGHRESVGNAEFIHCDLANESFLKEVFSSYAIQAVMHFAAYAYVGESVTDPGKYYQNNVASTLNLLRVLVKAGVRQFIFSSTCATYGNPIEIPITEDHPQQPINPYGASKLMVERILRDFDQAYGLKSVVFRYFNAAGADPDGEVGEWHEPETHLIPLVLDAASGRRANVRIFGTDYPTSDGTCIRDYIHVTDLADAHILGFHFLQQHNRSEVFNLGNGTGFSVREVISTAHQVTRRDIPTIETARRPGDPPVLVGSSEKAIKVLRWQPRLASLDRIIETAWGWHQKSQTIRDG